MFYGSVLLLNGKSFVIMRSAMSHMCNNWTTFHGIQSLSSSLTFIQTCPRVKNLMTTIKIHIVYGKSSKMYSLDNFWVKILINKHRLTRLEISFINARNINKKWPLHQNLDDLWNEYKFTWMRYMVKYFSRLKGKSIVNSKCNLL